MVLCACASNTNHSCIQSTTTVIAFNFFIAVGMFFIVWCSPYTSHIGCDLLQASVYSGCEGIAASSKHTTLKLCRGFHLMPARCKLSCRFPRHSRINREELAMKVSIRTASLFFTLLLATSPLV